MSACKQSNPSTVWVLAGLLCVAVLSGVSRADVFVDILADPAASAAFAGGDYYRVVMTNNETTDVTTMALDFTPLPTLFGLNQTVQVQSIAPLFWSSGDSFFVVPDGASPLVAGPVDGANVGLAAGVTLEGDTALIASGASRTVAYIGLPTGSADPATALGLGAGDAVGGVVTEASALLLLEVPVTYEPSAAAGPTHHPEPASLVLLSVGSLVLLRRR